MECELLGGIKSTICPFTHKEMANKYIQEKHSFSVISTAQWRGALICHLVPSTILFSTNNGVLFLLPFTLETSGHSWGRGCCLYPSRPDRFQPLLPLGGEVEKHGKKKKFFHLCMSLWDNTFLSVICFSCPLDSSRSALWVVHFGKHLTNTNVLFVTATDLI